MKTSHKFHDIAVYLQNLMDIIPHCGLGHGSVLAINQNRYANKIYAQLLEVGGIEWVMVALDQYWLDSVVIVFLNPLW